MAIRLGWKKIGFSLLILTKGNLDGTILGWSLAWLIFQLSSFKQAFLSRALNSLQVALTIYSPN